MSLYLVSCASQPPNVVPRGRQYSATLPEFPWPPPKASAFTVIPSEFFKKPLANIVYLSDLDRKLSTTLDSAGYFEKSYYYVPDGFAIVTLLEQISPDGTSKGIPDRWAAHIKPLNKFSFAPYLKALFTANPGYYRIIVFIITPIPFSQKEAMVRSDEARGWLSSGLNKLPNSIGKQKYSEDYTCTALIYEFEQSGSGKEAALDVPTHLGLSGRDHLIKARLWSELER